MPSFRKHVLSESINGAVINITATSTPGNLLHTPPATDAIDEIWLYCNNVTPSGQRSLTVEWTGVGDENNIVVGIPAEQGLVLVVPGLPATSGVSIRAYASQSGSLNVSGFVNRIV